MNYKKTLITAFCASILASQPLYAMQTADTQQSNTASANASQTDTKDWTQTFSMSAFGGFVMGNPDAELRISEYISYTCAHCATFELNQAPILKKDHVSKGNVSLEIRNAIRDPLDMSIAILARCGGEEKFFSNHTMFMREQQNIITRFQALSPDETLSWQTNSISNFTRDVMKSLKLDTLLMANGHSEEDIKQCITDQKSQQLVSQMTFHATLIQRIKGTPAFVINDEYQPAISNLDTLAPYLSN